MDPSEPGERCLPGMGLSGWMKRTMERVEQSYFLIHYVLVLDVTQVEGDALLKTKGSTEVFAHVVSLCMALIRSYDLSDICNSPPADGFYYPSVRKATNAGVAGKGNCAAESGKREDIRSCTIMGGVLSINQPATQHLNQSMGPYGDQYHHQTVGINNVPGCNNVSNENASSVSGYLKPVVSGLSKQISLGLTQSMIDSALKSEPGMINQQMSVEEMRNWVNEDGHEMYRTEHPEIIHNHPSDDTAPTPVDHIVSSNYTSSIGQADEGSSLRLVEKLGAGTNSIPVTPDVTPYATPAVTPSCSPQMARRAGNPFFTGGGDNDDKKPGSWLFRPGKKGDGRSLQNDKLYETKIEFQQQPNSKLSKKTVRYVPRPSELRELNFWSPTSM